MLIVSAKSRSARGASHEPAFTDSCLTISHKCLSCLPCGKVIPCVAGVTEESEDAWGAVTVYSIYNSI